MIPLAGRAILTAAEMRAAEAASGCDTDTLMDRAGQAIATAIRRFANGEEVLILCGTGNNGGDGYVAAVALRAAGFAVRAAASGEPKTDAARRARAGWAGPVGALADAAPAPILVDALFGTGLTRPLAIGDALHRLASAARLTIAIDLPSGVATDDGSVLTEPPMFDLTLALGAAKPAHVLQPAARFCGAVRILDIGIDDTSVDPHPSGASRLLPSPAGRGKGPARVASGKGEGSLPIHVLAAPSLPNPGPDSYKYTRGMVAVIPGAMPGAANLASLTALHAGAGYVLLLAPGDDTPHALVRKAYTADALTDPRIGAIVVGPGLGRDDSARARLDDAFASGRPLVVDGDALHLVDPDRLARHDAPLILTPHAGEFAALFGKSEGSKIDRTRAAAAQARAIVVHKGADTVIAAPDGRVVVAGDANDWLSAAGTGDVLAGAIGAMLASGLDPFAAAQAGVWLHGDAARRCDRAFLADDLARALTPARATL